MFGFPRQTSCFLSFRTISRNFWPLLWGRFFGFGDSRRGGALHRPTMNSNLRARCGSAVAGDFYNES